MSTRAATANDQPARPENPRTGAMTKGRQADSARRRQRVIAALDKAVCDGTEISVARIARASGRGPRILLPAPRPARPAPRPASHPARDRRRQRARRLPASLQTDLLAAGERAARLHSRVQQLEKRLSEALGEQAWRESGLGTPADIDALNQKIIHLEQQAIDLRLQLEEQGEDLAAARATNRELMTQLNHANRPL